MGSQIVGFLRGFLSMGFSYFTLPFPFSTPRPPPPFPHEERVVPGILAKGFLHGFTNPDRVRDRKNANKHAYFQTWTLLSKSCGVNNAKDKNLPNSSRNTTRIMWRSFNSVSVIRKRKDMRVPLKILHTQKEALMDT